MVVRRVEDIGATAAIGAGLSLVSGIMGASQKSKEANAQRAALDAQYQQTKLNADLQLFALRNQRMMDELNDTLVDAANKGAFLQTDASLKAQELTNKLAVENAIFSAQMQKAQGNVAEQQAQIAGAKGESDAVATAGAQALEALMGASQEEQAVVKAIMDGVAQSGDRETAIARLLHMGAASGGINEALANLAGGDAFQGLRAQGEIDRATGMKGAKAKAGEDVAGANLQLNRNEIEMALLNAGLQNAGTQFQGAMAEDDARTAQRVAELGFGAQRAGNQANYNMGIISNEVQRGSRYLSNLANEQALQQGVAIQGDILNAQKSAVRSPGLFDYVGIGFNAYNTYNQLSYNPSSRLASGGSGVSPIQAGQDYYRLNVG